MERMKKQEEKQAKAFLPEITENQMTTSRIC
jgi:hypothetical protein